MNNEMTAMCTDCGTPIPHGSTEPLCPACLMSGALRERIDETIPLPSAPPSSSGEPTVFPSDFGAYRLRGLLGRGGMGTVYEAEQIDTARRVALKRLTLGLDSPEMRQRFLREGRLAAGVSHPNSLYIFGSEEIEGVPVITMEVASGGTLRDRLKKCGPLPIPEAVDAILDVIAGLEAAFKAGVLHRDIKPSNCFVSPDGSVKIGDFGLSVSTLARDDSYVTATGVIMGTPAYASPEQLRGDNLDVRADIYSVGATLFTLLTNRAPFEGDNVVQVVANAVNQEPTRLTEVCEGILPGLERVVARCLAKEPDGRYADYGSLRNALLPFSSQVPEPASMRVRVSAGWIDFLIAFLPAYVVLMFLVGAEELLVRPLVERSLSSAKYYFVLLGIGSLYFGVFEGFWGAGVGKWLKGFRVVRPNGRSPGFVRALLRILIPILSVEGIRMPLVMAFISDADWTAYQTTFYVLATVVCPWIAVAMALVARPANAFAAVWDLATGTRVIVRQKGAVRPSMNAPVTPNTLPEGVPSMGPFRVIEEPVPGKWVIAFDPVLRRRVWLLSRTSSGPSRARQGIARPGRPRWLQSVHMSAATWDAFEATQGVPYAELVADGKRIPWGTLRHWLCDVASELWEASRDQTVPAVLSLDHVWITEAGRAILLDEPWPEVSIPAERVPVEDLVGQQRFLNTVAAGVEPTRVPLHAAPVLQNLQDGRFEKLSFLAGTLRGLLDKPADVGRGIRAGSIFMLPFYVWLAVFVGRYHDKLWHDYLGEIIILSPLAVLGGIALLQLLGLPFRSTVSHSIFRLAVVDLYGELAGASTLFSRWVVVWLPLLIPLSFLARLLQRAEGVALGAAIALLLLWLGACLYAVIHPRRGIHDQVAGTWVVRR